VLSMMDKGTDFGGPLIASGKIFTVDVTWTSRVGFESGMLD
jgi:hypothetical protein